MFSPRRIGLHLLATLCLALPLRAESPSSTAQLRLILPTENHSLFTTGGNDFYMFVDRDFQGVSSQPWQGGQYGFHREPRMTCDGVVYQRFHEGVDIKPVRRDANAEPLDPVVAIDAGRVVYINNIPANSNYGRYIVVEHRWGGCPYYSLYGHLNAVSVSTGQKVRQGDQLGRLGYTGVGIDKRRAHLHFEINLRTCDAFEQFHKVAYPKTPNKHGIWNGINLIGINPARLYLRLKESPTLTIPEFVAEEKSYFTVQFPNLGPIDLLKYYPWLARGAANSNPSSWQVSFTQGGVPTRFTPVDETTKRPFLVRVDKAGAPYEMLTKGCVHGSGGKGSLANIGDGLVRLITYPAGEAAYTVYIPIER